MQMQGQLLAIPPSLPPSGQSSPPPPSEEEKTHRVDFPLGRAKDSQSFSPPHFLSLYYSFCRRRTTKGPFSVLTLKAAFPFIFSPSSLASPASLPEGGGDATKSLLLLLRTLHIVFRGSDIRGEGTQKAKDAPPPSPPTMTEKKGALPSPLYFILLSPS